MKNLRVEHLHRLHLARNFPRKFLLIFSVILWTTIVILIRSIPSSVPELTVEIPRYEYLGKVVFCVSDNLSHCLVGRFFDQHGLFITAL